MHLYEAQPARRRNPIRVPRRIEDNEMAISRASCFCNAIPPAANSAPGGGGASPRRRGNPGRKLRASRDEEVAALYDAKMGRPSVPPGLLAAFTQGNSASTALPTVPLAVMSPPGPSQDPTRDPTPNSCADQRIPPCPLLATPPARQPRANSPFSAGLLDNDVSKNDQDHHDHDYDC